MNWQPISTAPLNPYGKAYGPIILVWCRANDTPVAAYFDPQGGRRDNGPRWVCFGEGSEMFVEDATHWMAIAAPDDGEVRG